MGTNMGLRACRMSHTLSSVFSEKRRKKKSAVSVTRRQEIPGILKKEDNAGD